MICGHVLSKVKEAVVKVNKNIKVKFDPKHLGVPFSQPPKNLPRCRMLLNIGQRTLNAELNQKVILKSSSFKLRKQNKTTSFGFFRISSNRFVCFRGIETGFITSFEMI
ncbi:hypothetical protein CRENBAI_024598 [Crenichthys baileyi]|uniref:Uncharacterized protein n=1 Tax=Crenichthys baileyi TaxID=28760 RepID=A0AAV9SQH0_9TELE